MSRNAELTLTEWDFDIPRDNRFHDPLNSRNGEHCERESPEQTEPSRSAHSDQGKLQPDRE